MPEPDAVATLIERIVAGARIPRARARDDLRRELQTHFEEAGAPPEALARFGVESDLTESLRRVYRLDYAVAYLVKIAAAVVASAAAALLIELLVNVRVEARAAAWRLAPGFSRGAGVSIAVVIGLVAAWEAARPPFNRFRAAMSVVTYAAICLATQALFAGGSAFVIPTILVAIASACSTLKPIPARLLLIFGAFAAVLYVSHLLVNVAFGPSRALVAGAVLVGVWSSTGRILARVDEAFRPVLEPAR